LRVVITCLLHEQTKFTAVPGSAAILRVLLVNCSGTAVTTMTKYLPNSAFLQSLPECELLICFDETPAHLLGGFNSILADRRDRLYFANLEGDILVLEQGNMPLAEADTEY
jgi:hypothetical protein